MLDVIVVGAGQAGLAAAYFLKQAGVRFLLLDKASKIGDSWRYRYDSLTLFTPREFSSLPDLSIGGNPQGLPDKNEVAMYLEDYQVKFNIPIQLETQVISMQQYEGGYILYTTQGEFRARQIIVATGPFQTPFIPEITDTIAPDIIQLHSSEYRNSKQLHPGAVLVVGGGNSGAQIAVELANDYHVYLSVSGQLHFSPLYFMGKSVFWFYNKLNLMNVHPQSNRGKWVQKQPEQIYGKELKKWIANNKIKVLSRSVAAKNNTIYLEDGNFITIQNIIWCTGFRRDYSWIHIPEAFDNKLEIKQTNGISNIPGLYYIGMPWLTSRGSALLGWVQHDAERIVTHLLNH